MSGQLKADLASDEAGRLEQAQADLKQRQAEIKERVATVSELLGGFRAESEKTAAAWQELASIMQAKRGMAVPEAKVVPEAPPAEEEAVAEVEPVEEMAPEKADLNDRVFAYLVERPDGARMTELETEFAVARIQMVQILKGLMDENRVEKRDMNYFAIQ